MVRLPGIALAALRLFAAVCGRAAGLLARFSGRFMRESVRALLDFARGQPKLTFFAVLFFVVAIAMMLPPLYLHTSLRSDPHQHYQQQQQGAGQREAGAPLLGVRPVVSGPLGVEERGGLTETTLGGVLPPGRALVAGPSNASPSAWGTIWADTAAEVNPVAATATWPLGGRHSRLTARVGFLPPTSRDGRPGGKYEVYLDGRKVWEATVTVDDAAMGRAADRTLELDLEGVRVLTLRVQALTHSFTSSTSTVYYSPTVPYPLVLYDIALTPAAAQQQEGGGSGNGAAQD